MHHHNTILGQMLKIFSRYSGSDKRDEKIEINTEPLKQLTAKDLWKKSGNRIPSLIEAEIPALKGLDRNEPWAKVLRELGTIDYYK